MASLMRCALISRSSVRPAQRANQDALGPAPSHGLAGPREDQAILAARGSSRRNVIARVSRRSLMGAVSVGGAVSALQWAMPRAGKAFTLPPPGFSYHVDQIDGYSFYYPSEWIQVTSSGNDVFYRNVRNLDENVFVSVSSPSTSRYDSVRDVGTPQEAAGKYLTQCLNELMSTRLGVRREGEIVSYGEREADGAQYYDLELQIRSYASRQQLAITAEEREGALELEWDRRLLITLGVGGKRLYELRLQTASRTADEDRERLRTIQESFRVVA